MAEADCRFRRPLTYPDIVSVGVRVIEVGQDRFVIQQRIVSHKLRAVAAEGEATIVLFDFEEKRKASLPAAVWRRIEEVEQKGLRKGDERDRP